MAVYTDVSDTELANFVSRYDIGRFLSAKGIAEGVENTNFLLYTERNRFILTLYEKRMKADDLPFFIELMEHLAQKDIICPQPVHDREGKVLQHLAGKPAAMVTFLSGASAMLPDVAHCEELGWALAQLHIAGSDFAPRRENALSLKDWRPLYEQTASQTDSISTGLGQRISNDLAFLESTWPQDLPNGVIHADLFPNNVFFQGNKLSGLIDFYFACNDMLAYDLAICLNAWCFEPDHSFNVFKGRAMIAAYESVRPLQQNEIDALPVLARGAALRFLLTRILDWLNVPPGALVKPLDPLEYDRKLDFHRKATSAVSYGYAA